MPEQQQPPQDQQPALVVEESVVPASTAQMVSPDAVSEFNKDPLNYSPEEDNQQKQTKGVESQDNSDSIPSNQEGLPTLEELQLDESLSQDSKESSTSDRADLTQLEIPDDENAKAFKQAFEKYLGFSVDELKGYATEYQQAVQEINQIRQQQYVEQSMNNLARDWGISYNEAENRLNQIRERFQRYTPEMQQRLDNTEGAKLIWTQIEQERSNANQSVPQFDRGSTVYNQSNYGGRKPMFTQKQIDGMSAREFDANYQAILKAYQMGLVSK